MIFIHNEYLLAKVNLTPNVSSIASKTGWGFYYRTVAFVLLKQNQQHDNKR